MRQAFATYRATRNVADQKGVVHAAHVHGGTWCSSGAITQRGAPSLAWTTPITCLWCAAGMVAW